MTNMKGGVVVSIRVNPKDCQSVLDVIEKAGIPIIGQSFSSMVSLALQSLLETARASGVLPEPDPFQYLNRVSPYLKNRNHAKKLQVSNAINGLGATLRAPPIPASAPEPRQQATDDAPVAQSVSPPAAPSDPEELRFASRRLTELIQKKDMVEDGVEGLVWSISDEQEYKAMYAIVYPEG